MSAERRFAALPAVLVLTTMVAAIISSLGAPLIPSIASDLDVSLSAAQWSLTVALLSGALSAPIMGRLGDGPHRRLVLIVGLAAVTLGGALSALAPSLGLLVAGRALQGIGLGLVPLTMAAARDHLPAERVPATIALLSVCAAAGVGAGYPVSGLIADGLGLSAAFWFGALMSALALAAVVLIVPSSSVSSAPRLDWAGVGLLSVGLGALLLAIAEGGTLGWGSPAIVGLALVAAVVLTTWVRQQLRTTAPLVELRLLRHPAVLTGDGCALVLGVAMYMYLSGVTTFVQSPSENGYGFGASVVIAGLCLVPFSITSLAASRALPWLGRTVGVRAVLPVGCLVVAAAGAFFAMFHTALWQAFVMLGIVGLGLGTTFAAIPGLVVGAVPERETGSAMGFYQVVRYIGFSIGSALAAALLAGHTAPGNALPDEGGYTLLLWVAATICVLAAALAWVLPGRRAAAGAEPAAPVLERGLARV